MLKKILYKEWGWSREWKRKAEQLYFRMPYFYNGRLECAEDLPMWFLNSVYPMYTKTQF